MQNLETIEMPVTMTVAEVALKFPGALEILKGHQLDYCCGGKKPFAEVCRGSGLEPDEIWNEIQLSASNRGSDSRMRFDMWETPFLIDFILNHHHVYVRESIPAISELLDKLCVVHGSEKPWLLTIRSEFQLLANELLHHMPKEEQILFPALRAAGDFKDSDIPCSQNGLHDPINVMEHEHESAGTLIKSIRKLTHQYTPPEDGCTTFRAAYMLLEQFDQDLMQHIHLENNILFPRASKIQ